MTTTPNTKTTPPQEAGEQAEVEPLAADLGVDPAMAADLGDAQEGDAEDSRSASTASTTTTDEDEDGQVAAEDSEDAEVDSADDRGDEEDAEKPPPKPPEDPRDRRIRELHQMVASKDELLRDYIKAHKQAQSEWESYKQRLARDREDELVTARGKVVERFLTVADNMERSIQASRVSDSFENLQEGMELVYKGFSEALKDLGLRRFDPTGEAFDPNSMEALGVAPVSDPAQDNTVIQCMQAGFALGDKELRPALVQVGKYSG